MRLWIRFAANLYPYAWRQRYGEEFDALLEDVRPGWREFTDVTRGALKMQMTTGATYLKLAGALAVVGAIAAGALSFRVPKQYVSSTVLQATVKQQGDQPISQAAIDKHLAYQLPLIEQQVRSRSSLSEMILRPSLDLYREERRHTPMEDIIEKMRRDLHVTAAVVHGSPVLNISFAYPDQKKAQAVARELVSKFIEATENWNRIRESTAQTVWRQPTPVRDRIEVLDPPSLPVKPADTNRLLWIGCGLGAGLLSGLILASILRRPKWSLQVGVCAVAGGALAYGISLRLPETYRSSAVMRITQSLDPKQLTSGGFVTGVTARVERMAQKILSRASLAGIIQQRSLDLYPEQRARAPLEEVIEGMRRNVAIRTLDSPATLHGMNSSFLVEFSYPDPPKAQAVVRELVSRFMEQNIIEERERGNADPEFARVSEYKAGENLEVLDPASLPALPISPNRGAVTIVGLLSGLLLGPLVLWFLQHRRMQRLQPLPEGG